MKRDNLLLALIFCGFLSLTSCSGSSTGSGTDNAPSAPVNLSGVSGDQQVELSWNANTEDDLSGYNLYRSTRRFSTASELDPINGNKVLTNPSFTDSELENGTTYYYRVTAIDDGDKESPVSPQLEITPFSNPPDRP